MYEPLTSRRLATVVLIVCCTAQQIERFVVFTMTDPSGSYSEPSIGTQTTHHTGLTWGWV